MFSDSELNFKEGSHAYQVVQLNKRIANLTNHLKVFRKDNVTKLALFKLVSKRKRFMKYLKNNNFEQYQLLTKKK